MEWLQSKIRVHWRAMLLAIFFGLVVASPNFVIFSGDFKGMVYPTFNDEETYYQARVSEVVEGNWKASNPYIKELKDGSFLVPPIAEWIMATGVILSGLSVPQAMILYDILFTIISFFLFYLLFLDILKSKSYSLIYSSLFFILFAYIFGRPVNPQITTIFFIFGLFLIYKIYYSSPESNELTNRYGVLLGLNIGIVLFISPYHGSALMVLYSLIIFMKQIFEDGIKNTLKSTKYFILFFSPFLVLYGFFILKLQDIQDYTDSALRFGLINTYHLGSHTNILLAFLCLAIFLVNKSIFKNKEKWLFLSFLLSIVILNWQNVITGQMIQFASHYYMISVIIIFICLALTQRTFLDKYSYTIFDKKKIVVSFLITLTILGIIVYKQKNEVINLGKLFLNEKSLVGLQDKVDIFNWINKNTEVDSVFYTLGGDYDYLIPVYTHSKVYYNFYATLSIMSNNETEDRWLNQQIFNPNVDKKYILENQRDFWCNRFIDSYYFKENRKKILSAITFSPYSPSQAIEDRLINDLLNRYGEKKKKSDPISVLSEYEINYILVSPNYPFYKKTVSYLDEINSLERQVSIEGVYIYKVINQ